ncbi:MAG: hypothetical protein KF833_01975 [Verrucomicrobiae bacterium]|nr:hypothetical protein [Verrucomicrobiae bacterium]
MRRPASRPATEDKSAPAWSMRGTGFLPLVLVLIVVLGFLFRDSFRPGMALFANDGPLGLVASEMNAMPEGWRRVWLDLNWLGFDGVSRPLTWNFLWLWLLGPHGYINFAPALASLLLGVSVGLFCRASGLRSEIALLAGLAGALNSDFFSYGCWGLPTLTVCVASAFLALAALQWKTRPFWVRGTLAGAALGHAVMEGFDNGAILSLYVAAFAVFQAWNERGSAPALARLGAGLVRTAVMALAAGVVAIHVMLGLIQTGITGTVGMTQDTESREARWGYITQWSLPPKETLRAVIPGLFGYRMDTPGGGEYWGKVGMDIAWDDYWASDRRDPADAPPAQLRHSGAGHYAGVLVVWVAMFGVVLSLRRNSDIFTPVERRWIWFWGVAAIVSLLFAYGRFAPFYRIVYAIPYLNTIRIPMKFLHPFNIALVILFAYGLQGLWRGWVARSPIGRGGLVSSFREWWPKAASWERGWMYFSGLALAAAIMGWLMLGSTHGSLAHLRHLAEVGFRGPDAEAVARFARGEAGTFVMVLAVCVLLMTAMLTRWLSGDRARAATIALGLFLVLDLARANTPWIIHYNWKDRLATNPVFDTLRAEPHLGRVSGRMPFAMPGEAGQLLRTLGSVYGGEWLQHQLPYYDIQALEVVQMPRPPADYMAYAGALRANPLREWELTNTRYLLALAPLVEAMNQQLDPERRRFRVHTAFTLGQTPDGLIQLSTNREGPFALIEFSGVLPRAMLFDQWREGISDEDALRLLASPEFDPRAEVLVAQAIPKPSVETSHQPAGTADYIEYGPTRFVIRTEARTPSVLLVNDRFAPGWQVKVDGRDEPMLRANYVMRGVYLSPGAHEVEFRFEPPARTLWTSLAALSAAFGILGWASTGRFRDPLREVSAAGKSST